MKGRPLHTTEESHIKQINQRVHVMIVVLNFRQKQACFDIMKTYTKKKNKVECDSCGKTFARKDHLYRHKREQHNELRKENLSYVVDLKTLNANRCGKCENVFTRASDLKKHIKQVHEDSKQKHKCTMCEKTFGWRKSLERHVKAIHSHA